MAENKPSEATAPKPAQTAPTDYAHVSMSEEFSSSKWTLPPVGVVGIALLAVAVIVGAIAWFTRAKPGAKGAIDDVGVVQLDPNSVMVAVQLSLTNTTDRTFWVRQVNAKLQGSDGKEYTDTAASAADFERYFQAFPDLKQHASAEPLKRDVKIAPGATIHGSAIFSFPVAKDAFDARKSLSVIVQPFDQPVSVVLTK
jgi:hypothetical protein